MKRIFSLSIIIFVLCACNSSSKKNDVAPILEPAQPIIFFNGSVLTMEKDFPQAEAIAVQEQKILAVGSNEEILALQEPQTLLVDLGGRTLMPGFVDAHTHLLNNARAANMSLDEAQWMALRNGITTLGDLFVDRSFLREIQTFDEVGSLRVRTGLYLVYNDPCGKVFGTWYKSIPSTRQPGEMLRINGIKIFTDGGSCGHPTLSFELKEGEGLGDLWLTQDELNRAVKEAQSQGYQVAIHAIGDHAVEQAQNAIAYALDGESNVFRHRMEHVSVLQPGMVSRFQEIGIVPVLPGEYPSCAPFGPPLPEQYGDWEWPWKTLREESPDLNIAWHTDYPFTSISPIVHLYGFVTRNDVYRNYTCPAHMWLRDDTLSVEQALSIMTVQSAYALFREEEIGSLKPGKYADLIVLSENPLEGDPANLLTIRVIASMVGGRFEYCLPDQLDLCPGYVIREPSPLPDTRPPVFVRWLMLILVPALPLLIWRFQKAGKNAIQRFGWAAGIAGGLCWIATLWFDGEASPVFALLTLFAVLFLSIFIASMLAHLKFTRLMQAFLILTGLGIVMIGEGFILLEWFNYEQGWLVWILGMMVQIVGVFLFGMMNLKTQVFPRWNFVPLLMGLAGIAAVVLSSIQQASASDLPAWMLVISIGGGWMAIGISLINKQID